MPNPNFPTAQSQKVSNLWGTDHAAADEGNYYTASNPTPGTAIATTTSVVDDAATASSTHGQNVPVIHIQNTASVANANAKSIYLKYLTMMLVQVPTSATAWRFAVRSDSAPRYTSGGSLIVPQNVNSAFSNQSVSAFYFGAVVTALGSANMRLLAGGSVGSVIPVTLDVWTFTFGDTVAPSNFLNGSASAKNVTIPLPPVIIGPGCNLNIEMWGGSNGAAPSWEFTAGLIERVGGQ
jgi:hypothetical protein